MLSEPNDPGTDLRLLSTPELIDFIVERHHGYLRTALPFVRTMAAKVARVHGGHDERLRELDEIVRELADLLEPHLEEEETQLFPKLTAEEQPEQEIRAALEAMVTEHAEVGALLGRMRSAASDFSTPDWACGSYRALFAELERLEHDVLFHVHAENHVLKPRFVAEQRP